MGDGRLADDLVPAPRSPHRRALSTDLSSAHDAEAGRMLSPIQRRLLDLQRSAGNTAVATAMARRPVVQRDKAPAWVTEAQKQFKTLFPKEKLLQGVVIKDYGDLNVTLQGADFGAWTQSKTEIYVRDPATVGGDTPAKAKSLIRFVLQHEANHIRQFATANGPPKKWADMLKFEIEAYRNDKKWLAANGKTEIPDKKLRDMLVKGTDDNLRNAIEMQKLAAKEKDPETFLHNEMKSRDFIPKDAAKDPLELYKQD